MVDTIGKRLCQARLAKGLTIDEAAHATKMRPDKILALENDDYSRFGNNAYAKGFLQIYGRFLGVDVAGHLRDLEIPTRVSVDDYQYLNNAPEPPKAVYVRQERKAGPPSVIPLLVVVAIFFVSAYVFWIVVSTKRLGLDVPQGRTADKQANPAAVVPGSNTPSSPAVAPANPPATPSSSPATRPASRVDSIAATNPEAPRTSQSTALIHATAAPPTTGMLDGVEVRRAQAASPEPITPGSGINEVVVEPIKTTWVVIRKGRPDSPPVFEDYLYQGAAPLKLHGPKFFVEVRDQTAVQIRKNGNPIAYQAPGISIQ